MHTVGGGLQVVAQVVGSLPSTWEAPVVFQAPSFDQGKPWLLQVFGGVNQQKDLCYSAFQIKINYFNMYYLDKFIYRENLYVITMKLPRWVGPCLSWEEKEGP